MESNALLAKMWMGSGLVMKGSEQELAAEQSPPLLWALSIALILTQTLQHVTVQQKNNHVSLSNPGTWQMEMLCWEHSAMGSNDVEALGHREQSEER